MSIISDKTFLMSLDEELNFTIAIKELIKIEKKYKKKNFKKKDIKKIFKMMKEIIEVAIK